MAQADDSPTTRRGLIRLIAMSPAIAVAAADGAGADPGKIWVQVDAKAWEGFNAAVKALHAADR